MKWVGHVAYMGERKNSYKIVIRKLSKRDDSGDLGINRE
jgi:hypothetical protein